VEPNRQLDWDGCFNVRDLGGLPAADGLLIRPGALVRADAVDRLSAAGWSAVVAYGIRTVIDLRNPDELGEDRAPRPAALETVNVALDGVEDTGFWGYWASGPQFGSPLYYGPFLERFPQRTAEAVAAVAKAPPGGVLVHCGRGRDRTGLITMVLLSLLGVADEEIAADYLLSIPAVRKLCAALGEDDEGVEIDAFHAGRWTSAREVILETLESLDVEAYLLDAGLSEEDLTALRSRLLPP